MKKNFGRAAVHVDLGSTSLADFKDKSELETMLDGAFALQKETFLKKLEGDLAKAGHDRVTFDRSVDTDIEDSIIDWG